MVKFDKAHALVYAAQYNTIGGIELKYPMGFWNYNHMKHSELSHVQDWSDLGFTMPMSPHYNAHEDNAQDVLDILDAAHEKGMKVIVNDMRSNWRVLTQKGEREYREMFEQTLKDFGSHPAAYGFHVGDEPQKDAFEDACRAQAIQAEMSPNHLAFLNLMPWHYGIEDRIGYVDYSEYLDVYCEKSKTKLICYDCYSQMNPGESGFDMYFNNLRIYHDAARRNNLPFWTTLLSVALAEYRAPSYDEARWQLNTAAAHGAKGILWFYIYQHLDMLFSNFRNSPINRYGRRTAIFTNVSENVKDFMDMFGDTLMRLTLNHVWHYGRCYGGFPMFMPDSRVKFLSSTNDCPLILSYFTADDGHEYMMLVNNSMTKNTSAKITLRGSKKLSMCYPGGIMKEIMETIDSPYVNRTGELTELVHWLCPGQAILFTTEDMD